MTMHLETNRYWIVIVFFFLGGCIIQLGIEVCNVPSERYDHGAVTFNDGTMYVYGGFSERCGVSEIVWYYIVLHSIIHRTKL